MYKNKLTTLSQGYVIISNHCSAFDKSNVLQCAIFCVTSEILFVVLLVPEEKYNSSLTNYKNILYLN